MATTTNLADQIFKAGHTAVITGASSGIGRATAAYCASQGMNVYMADIDEDDLVKAMEYVKSLQADDSGSIVEGVVTDVSDFSSVQALAEQVLGSQSSVHFLMNNAGVGKGGGALASLDTFHHVLGVNLYGPINGCQAFLPAMKRSQEPGLIVNTGSKQGITMPPGNLVYNISKAALKCYTEGLEHELRSSRESNDGTASHSIYSALLVPGWTNTSIALKAMDADADKDTCFFYEDKPAAGAWMPFQVVEFMISELKKGRFYIICPDNDVDRETDNLRMEWTMQDIIQNRPPLSRWHDDYKVQFEEFVKERKSNIDDA